MITNTNASKTSTEYFETKKYIGVASVHVMAINPDNAKLRLYGWHINEGADEPRYAAYTDENGNPRPARVRFLVQIQDLETKPIVAMDFPVYPNAWKNSDGTKVQIIDAYGRTAWATEKDIENRAIPMYSNGPAIIAPNYKLSHRGQEELVGFIRKYCNVTPYNIPNRDGTYRINANAGTVTIDNWDALCKGDASEIATMIASQPDNMVKVALGVRHDYETNRSYQVFLKDAFFGNGSVTDSATGIYLNAEKAIARYYEEQERYASASGRPSPNINYSAAEVKEWTVTASEVNEAPVDNVPTNLIEDDLPMNTIPDIPDSVYQEDPMFQ